MTDTQIILTAGSSWPVPPDWNNAANKIEMIGGGAAGGATNGGNGADYAKAANLALTVGANVSMQIGAAGTSGASGGDTWFGAPATVQAKGGGSASSSVGSTTYAGGTTSSPGGGGAAGPNGPGGNASGNTGGTGDNDAVPPDTSGTEWGAAGSGGGGSYTAPPSGPVQMTGVSVGQVATGYLPFLQKATAGNTLTVFLAGLVSTQVTDAGWTLQKNSGGNGIVCAYTKVSDGTETGVNFGTTGGASTGRIGACMQEWHGSLAGTLSFGSNKTTVSGIFNIGPTNAPPSSTAIAVIGVCIGSTSALVTAHLDAPWSYHSTSPTNGAYVGITGWQAAGGSALSITGGGGGTSGTSWTGFVNLWIEPS